MEASLDSAFASGVVEESFTTSPTVPAPPTGLAITSHGDETLTVVWTAPTDNGGSDITGYKVQWKSGTLDFGSAREQNAGDTATSHQITGLTNGTTYTAQSLSSLPKPSRKQRAPTGRSPITCFLS